jgi:hypothetical protein
VWFSAGNSVAAHGLSTAETRTETLSLFVKLPNRNIIR